MDWRKSSAAGLRVVGRMSLSPRHSIVLVQAGNQTLMIGLGPQAAPTLLGEIPLVERPEDTTAPANARSSLGRFPANAQHDPAIPDSRRAVSVCLGDEE
jgi:flagellar biogenesis protein FliO